MSSGEADHPNASGHFPAGRRLQAELFTHITAAISKHSNRSTVRAVSTAAVLFFHHHHPTTTIASSSSAGPSHTSHIGLQLLGCLDCREKYSRCAQCLFFLLRAQISLSSLLVSYPPLTLTDLTSLQLHPLPCKMSALRLLGGRECRTAGNQKGA